MAQVPFALRAATGDTNAASALAAGEWLKQNFFWQSPMAQPFADVAATYADRPWYERLYYSAGNAVANPGAAAITMAESGPQVIPQMLAGAGGATLGSVVPGVGTVAGGAAGVGLMSGLQDFASEYLDAFRKVDVDTTDPVAFYAATMNDKIRSEAAKQAAAHGIAVGVFDGLTMGVSSKLRPFVKGLTKAKGFSRFARAALPRVADTVTQGLGGSAGELSGQIAQGRDKIDMNAVVMEFVAEALQGGFEGTFAGGKDVFKGRPTVTAANAEAWARLNPEAAAKLAQANPSREAWDEAGLSRTTAPERAAVVAKLREITGFGTPTTPSDAPADATPTTNPDMPGPSPDADLPSADGSQGPTPSSGKAPAPVRAELPPVPDTAPPEIASRWETLTDQQRSFWTRPKTPEERAQIESNIQKTLADAEPAAGTTPDVSPPEPAAAPPRKGYFTKSDLEFRIVQSSGMRDVVDGIERQLEETAAANNRNLDLSGGINEDVVFEIGQDMADMLRAFRAILAGGRAKLGKDYGKAFDVAKRFMRASPDPELRFLAAMHDNLPVGKTPPKIAATPSDLPAGTTFKINGDQFQVVPHEDGYLALKDGEDYPVVPVEALSSIPVDKGTLKPHDGSPLPTVRDTRPAVSDATRQVLGIDTAPELPPTQRDLLGNPTVDPETGSQQEMVFGTEGATPSTAPARSGQDAAIANRYDQNATDALPTPPDDGIPFRTTAAGQPANSPSVLNQSPTPPPRQLPTNPLDDSWRGPTPAVFTESSKRPKVLSAQWLVKFLSEKFNVPIRYGDLGRRASNAVALGWYRARDQVIRVRGNAWGNLWVAGHEVAHHLDKTLDVIKNLSATARRELASLDYDTKRVASGSGLPSEGFGEYMARYWLGEGDLLAAHAPTFTAEFFSGLLPKHADTQANVGAFGDHVMAYLGQKAVDRFRATINPDDQDRTAPVDQQGLLSRARARVGRWFRQFVLEWTDAGYDITALDAQLKKAGTEPDIPLDHIYRVANRQAAQSGLDAFMHGAYYMSEGQGVRRGVGFAKVLELMENRGLYDDVRDFWLARHALEVMTPTADRPAIDTPFRREDLQEIVNTLGKDKRIVAAADALVSMANSLVDAMVDARQISGDAAKAMKDAWTNYAPMLKVREDKFGTDPYKGLRKVGGTPFKRLKGSRAQVIDPVAALAWRYMSVYQNLYRADLTNNLIDALKRAPAELQRQYLEADFDPNTQVTSFSLDEISKELVDFGFSKKQIQQILDTRGAAGLESMMQVFRPDYQSRLREPGMVLRFEGNQKKLYRLNSDLTAAVQAIAPMAPPEMLVSLLGGFTKVQRFGAVPVNLGFVLSNPIKDYATYLWQGEGNLIQRMYEPPVEALRLLRDKLARVVGIKFDDPAKELFESTHSSPHLAVVGYKPDAAAIRDVLAKTGQGPIASRVGRGMIRVITSLNEAMESIPRMAAFRHALREHGFTNADLRRGLAPSKKALYAASQAAAESTVDFSRSGRQKWLSRVFLFANAMIQSNARFLRNFTSAEGFGRAAPAMALQAAATILYWLDVKDEDWWKNADRKLKYRFWIFSDKDGIEYLRLPMSYETGAYYSGTMLAALDAIEQKDASIPWRFVLNTMGQNIAKPSAIMPAIDVYANWDSFRDRPIVPRGQQDDPAYTQYGPQTTIAARTAGRALNVSPSKLEYLLDGYTGGLFRRVVRPIELVGTGEKGTMRDVPFISNITFAQHFDGSQEMFQEALQEAKTAARKATDEGRTVGVEFERLHELDAYDSVINEVRRANRDVRGRSEREAFEKYLIGLRRRALGQEDLKRFPDPIRHPPNDTTVQKAIRDLLSREADAATDPMPTRQKTETAKEFTDRVTKWNLRRQRATALLEDTGQSPKDLRSLLAERQTKQGYSTRVLAPNGKPTAFGERLKRLGQLEPTASP